jgi:exodeoxyribonuclease-3
MKIIAWNVNGIRSLLKTNYLEELLENEDPDILCIGETKLPCNSTIDNELLSKYKYKFFGNCKKAGYSGTAIFSNKKPLNVIYGLKHNNTNIDDEGRMITLEFKNYYLIHVYTPNSGQALARLDWRVDIWDKAFYQYIFNLQKDKPIILCGDLNVAHHEIDIKNSKSNLRTAGYTIEERTSFNNFINDLNLIDSFRYIHPDKIKYSYWSYRMKSREKNIGWRLDYFILSKKLVNKIIESDILTNIYGSDHAPIKLKLK